ncbi:MAG TPA: biotin carboxylase [Thermoanaerobaculia bacterium]|nr:biotin carboxylase [Thermoanaerobaculia bacterium]
MGKSIPRRAVPAKSGRSQPVPPTKSGAIPHPRKKPKKLKGLSDIRRFFHRNDEPVYFISATNFNLLSMDEWVHRFRFINYVDCFDGQHPNVFVPSELPHPTFESLEQINNYLLRHPEVREFIQARGSTGKAVFLFFDEETEKLCEELGLQICFPAAALRSKIDDKINTTRIGNRARVRSVPNVLTTGITSYRKLRKEADKLGKDLVVQTAYGDSGHTTFFIKSEKDWREHASEISPDEEVKIMKRVDVHGAALEACITKAGTIVGPLMTELVGFRELTPYKGGWCGNEVFPDSFPKKIRDAARRKTEALGAELAKEGYTGYFEVDYLIDKKNGALYLGEINPRITGASSMTNLAAFAHADAPLFLFHLLEFFDVDYELDVDELNERWTDPENIDTWSQMVIKHTEDDLKVIDTAPPSGVWGLDADGGVGFLRPQTHRRTVERLWEGFFLRIAKPGDYLYEGADMGILITPGRLMDEKGRLTERARAWADGMKGQFHSVKAGPGAVQEAPAIGRFKIY